MVVEAPKSATLVDDFRYLALDRLLWTPSGTVSVEQLSLTGFQRGCRIESSSSISSFNASGARRLDMYDSEVVWTVNQYSSTGTSTFQVMNLAGTYGYRFVYDGGFGGGRMLVQSVEAGVTYTGADFLDGSGNIAVFPYFTHLNGMLRYLRIAHSATNNKIEFFAGTNPDGSDQRLFSSDLGTGAKGTLIATQANLDNMVISVSTNATGQVTLGSVNAPNEGLNRYPDSPTTYYYRDFSSWVAYGSTNQGIFNADGVMSHEWYTRSWGSSLVINQDSPTQKSLRPTGSGSKLASLVTYFPQGIKNVNIKVTAGFLAVINFESMFAISWRNALGFSGTSMQRYQLTIQPNSIGLDVFPYTAANATTFETATVNRLNTIQLSTVTGVKYDWEINHFEDRIVVKRDGVEVMNFTDIASSNPVAGNIGIQVGSINPISGGAVTAVFDKIEVTEAYDDQNFARGAMLQDRKIGFHVKKGWHSGFTTMQTTPTIVNDLENSFSLPNTNTVYLYTDVTAVGSGAVDTATINAARTYAREGRTVVICLNALGDSFSQLNPLTAGWQNALNLWSAAINSIGSTVYLMILPFPDLNVQWSPYGHFFRDVVAVGSTSTVINSTATLTAGALVGKGIRIVSSNGAPSWTTITANTTSTITYTSAGVTPAAGTYYFVSDTNITGATANIGSPSNYVTAYRNIVTYLKSLNTRAYYVFAMNYNPSAEFKNTGGATGYSGIFDLCYPGNDYVDAFLIRALQSGTHNDLTIATYESMWQPLEVMLSGRTILSSSASSDKTFPLVYKDTPYYRMNTIAPSKKMFVLAGCAETHEYYNDCNYGIPGEAPDAFVGHGFGAISPSAAFIRWWITPNASMVNPRKPNSLQRGIRTTGGGTTESYFGWTIGTGDANISKIISMSCYVKISTVIGGTNNAYLIAFRDGSGVVQAGIRFDQNTGDMRLMNAAGTINVLIGNVPNADLWYRLELSYAGYTGQTIGSITRIRNESDDRPLRVDASAQGGVGVNINQMLFGNMLANSASVLTGDVVFQDLKVSTDMKASVYSKSRWLKEALETRGFPQIDTTIFVSADSFKDLPSTPGSLSGAMDSIYSQNFTGSVDMRVDLTNFLSSTFSATGFKNTLNVPDPKRIHSAPQVVESGYTSSSSVGNLEYMYLKEIGYVPLYLTPRVGGILLRDFNLGSPTVRVSQEDRPNGDGVRDFTRYLGAKSVSLSFVVFDDASGSAAFYADALASWANPRRRPMLVYKMKDGQERSIRLRPETSDGAWVTDGIRSGFKEISMNMVGIDGKDYATKVSNSLVLPGLSTPLISNGTAPTPPIIRIWGGSTGAQNSLLVLQTEEKQLGKALARLGFGTSGSPFMIPINQFVEINVENRTAQLNGEPGEGNSMVRYMNDKQWFYIDTYYNYLVANDGLGSASPVFQIFWQDAYL